jgi:hypothetical protein
MFKYRMIDARGWQGKIEFWKLILMKNNEKHMHKKNTSGLSSIAAVIPFEK